MKRSIFKKIFLIIIACLQILSLSASQALAFKIPSASSIAAQLENRYHVNLQSIQQQGEYFNSTESKKMAPQVMLSFDPSDPKIGQKITANAFPMYFGNPKEDLYFTWYLKHAECKESSSGDSDYRERCDLDDNNRVNQNDWKIAAMRIIASNGFDAEANGIDYRSASADNDSYRAIFGGADREGMPSHCFIHDFTDGLNYELSGSTASNNMTCANGGSPICAVSETTVADDGSGGSFTEGDQCVSLSERPVCSAFDSNGFIGSQATPQCSNGIAVCSTITNGVISATQSCSSFFTLPTDQPVCTGTAASTASSRCEHYFAEAPGHDAGDNSFGSSEESFWHTNPFDSNTSKNGNRDEANVVGLGQDKFSWNYAPGDKVGVIIEGSSINPTRYDDSSYMIMWALPKNKCEVENKGTMIRSIKGYNVSIPTADMDLNDCIADNLIDPREGNEASRLDVSLSYSPENPLNDPSGEAADRLIVTSSVLNIKNPSYLKYAWSIYRSDEINPESWGDPLRKDELPGIAQTSGLGLTSLSLNMSFNPMPKYLKVRLEVTENIDSETTNTGISDIIVPLTSASNRIRIFPGVVSDALSLSMSSREICSQGVDSAVCPIIRNEVLGVRVSGTDLSQFQWQLDGKPILPFSFDNLSGRCLFGECTPNGSSNNIAYFPILKNIGEKYVLSLTATGDDGEKINISRTLQVSEPSLSILSGNNDSARPILRGYYTDLEGTTWDDFSKNEFEVLSGSVVKMLPNPNIPVLSDYAWSIDGYRIDAESAPIFGASLDTSDGSITFPAAKPAGEVFSLGLTSNYIPSAATKKFLNRYWDIQPSDFYEKEVVAGVSLFVTDTFEGDVVAKKPVKKALAAIFSGLPGYLLFLFRIVLTSALVLFSTRFLFSFLANANKQKNVI